LTATVAGLPYPALVKTMLFPWTLALTPVFADCALTVDARLDKDCSAFAEKLRLPRFPVSVNVPV
jgi:hypothetical protein